MGGGIDHPKVLCMQFSFLIFLVVPHITVYDRVVSEGVGTVTVQFNRTGGDLTVGSSILASTRDSAGMYVCGEISIEKAIKEGGEGGVKMHQMQQIIINSSKSNHPMDKMHQTYC